MEILKKVGIFIVCAAGLAAFYELLAFVMPVPRMVSNVGTCSIFAMLCLCTGFLTEPTTEFATSLCRLSPDPDAGSVALARVVGPLGGVTALTVFDPKFVGVGGTHYPWKYAFNIPTPTFLCAVLLILGGTVAGWLGALLFSERVLIREDTPHAAELHPLVDCLVAVAGMFIYSVPCLASEVRQDAGGHSMSSGFMLAMAVGLFGATIFGLEPKRVAMHGSKGCVLIFPVIMLCIGSLVLLGFVGSSFVPHPESYSDLVSSPLRTGVWLSIIGLVSVFPVYLICRLSSKVIDAVAGFVGRLKR